MVADSKDGDFKSSTTDGLDKVNANYDFPDDSLKASPHFNLLSDENCHKSESKALPSKYDAPLSNPSKCNVLKVSFPENNTDKEHTSNDFVIQIEDNSKTTSSASSETHQETDLKNKRKSPSKKRKAMSSNKKTCFKVPSEDITETEIEYEFAPNLSSSSEEESMECTSSSDSRFADVEDNVDYYSNTYEELKSSVEHTADSFNDSSDESKKLVETSSISDSRIIDVKDNAENSISTSIELKSSIKRKAGSSNALFDESKRPIESCSSSDSQITDVKNNVENSRGTYEELKSSMKRTAESSNALFDESKIPIESCSSSDSGIANVKDNVENSSGTSDKPKTFVKRMVESSNASSDESKRPMESCSSSDSRFADVEDSAESSNGWSSEELNSEFYEIGKPSSESVKTLSDFKKNINEVNRCNTTVEVATHKTELTSMAGSKSNTLNTSKLPNSLKIRSDVARNKKRRCLVCKKKLDLTAVTCRCGGLFCAKHRYDKEHSCTFDYKTMGAEQLRKDNPQIIAEKVSRL